MTLRLPATLLLGLTMMLGACGDDENAPGPGGVSAGEARALDDAAAMIESQPAIPDDTSSDADDNDLADDNTPDDPNHDPE